MTVPSCIRPPLLKRLLLLFLFSWYYSVTITAWTSEMIRIGPQNGHVESNGRTRRIRSSLLVSTSSSTRSIPPQTLLRISPSSSPPSHPYNLQQPLQLEQHRDMQRLSSWARSQGVVLADGIQLTEDTVGDWSLRTSKGFERGSSIMSVPSHLILSSDVNDDSFLRNVHAWMVEMGTQSQQDYLPEYMLVYKIIQEVYLGKNSQWYEWLQCLPRTFSTGLYLDELERYQVERMAGKYIRSQDSQYHDCLSLIQKLISSQGTNADDLIPTDFYQWMIEFQHNDNNDDDDEDLSFNNLVRWAFTVVFTRSWRSPDRKHAQIVPLGDLANHDSQLANLQPSFRQKDGAFQFYTTNDIDVVEPTSLGNLYLSYGLSYAPARYLVLFGFCDVTAAYIDAQLDFLEDDDSSDDNYSGMNGGKWPTTLDPSQLVVSTTNGALSEDVWIAFLYKVLYENDPEMIPKIRNAFADDDDHDSGDMLLEQLLETWEWKIGMEIKAHYQRLMETDFTLIIASEYDLAEHPNLSMIINYNLFIREAYLNVLKHVNTFIAQSMEFQEISDSKGKNKEEDVDIAAKRASSIFGFKNDVSEILNEPSKNSYPSETSLNILRPMGDLSSQQSFSSSYSTYSQRKKTYPSAYTSTTDRLGDISTECFESQPNSFDQTSQERIDAMTMYTQSLVLDQRGNPRQTEDDSDNQYATNDGQEQPQRESNATYQLPVSSESLETDASPNQEYYTSTNYDQEFDTSYYSI
jgi:hypothetical protein